MEIVARTFMLPQSGTEGECLFLSPDVTSHWPSLSPLFYLIIYLLLKVKLFLHLLFFSKAYMFGLECIAAWIEYIAIHNEMVKETRHMCFSYSKSLSFGNEESPINVSSPILLDAIICTILKCRDRIRC